VKEDKKVALQDFKSVIVVEAVALSFLGSDRGTDTPDDQPLCDQDQALFLWLRCPLGVSRWDRMMRELMGQKPRR